ncbi:MAG: hypothetical protein HDS82_02950 [Bacteroidales bacterium]|nr:hypothetical protein [Bacteroidales bacterium]
MEESIKHLADDTDGMATYEWIVNHSDSCGEEMSYLIDNLKRCDGSGQFLASSARFLNAVDAEKFSRWIPLLVEGVIEKDREHRYLMSLLEALWGEDYMERAETLKETDNNFRRIYKRVYPTRPF